MLARAGMEVAISPEFLGDEGISLPEDLDDAGRSALKMAVCAQLDSGLNRPVDEESAGDFRSRLAGSLVRIGGMPVAPGAVGFLRSAGALQQWV